MREVIPKNLIGNPIYKFSNKSQKLQKIGTEEIDEFIDMLDLDRSGKDRTKVENEMLLKTHSGMKETGSFESESDSSIHGSSDPTKSGDKTEESSVFFKTDSSISLQMYPKGYSIKALGSREPSKFTIKSQSTKKTSSDKTL